MLSFNNNFSTVFSINYSSVYYFNTKIRLLRLSGILPYSFVRHNSLFTLIITELPTKITRIFPTVKTVLTPTLTKLSKKQPAYTHRIFPPAGAYRLLCNLFISPPAPTFSLTALQLLPIRPAELQRMAAFFKCFFDTL